MIYNTYYDSPIGKLMLASDGDSIIGLWMEGQKYFGGSVKGEMKEDDKLPIFIKAKDWLKRYFNGENPDIKELSLSPIGGDFRQEVWQILCSIPYGELMTYGDIAKAIAKKKGKETMSAQAVGGAVGHNPISIIIPCHRVVGTNGSLTGFAGGIDKKIKLLELEKTDMSKLHKPVKGTAL